MFQSRQEFHEAATCEQHVDMTRWSRRWFLSLDMFQLPLVAPAAVEKPSFLLNDYGKLKAIIPGQYNTLASVYQCFTGFSNSCAWYTGTFVNNTIYS